MNPLDTITLLPTGGALHTNGAGETCEILIPAPQQKRGKGAEKMITQQKDLTDLRTEFELMLKGFVESCKDMTPTRKQCDKLLCAWNDLDQEIINVQSDK